MTDVALKLASLQAEFKQQLPAKIADIEQLWKLISTEGANNTRLQEFHQMVYSLANSGGIYCAVVVSKVARDLEQTLKFMMLEYSQESSLSKMKQRQVNSELAGLKLAINNWQPSVVKHVNLPDQKEQVSGNLVYLIAKDEILASCLVINLEEAGYRVRHFIESHEIVTACELEMPAVIIMDVASEGDDFNSNEVKILKRDIQNCPPVVLISVRDEMKFRLKAVRAGANKYLCKPLDMDKLNQILAGLTVHEIMNPYRVLLIDNDIPFLECYATAMREAGIVVETLSNPIEGLNVLSVFKPDVIIMDVYMPECSGPELVQVIRHDDDWALTPIIFLSAESNINSQLTAMEYGADDFLEKPVKTRKLVATITAMAKRARKNIQLIKDLHNVKRESEFQLVTMDQHAIVSITDVTGRITSVNDKFCEVSGYTREELIGQNHRLLKSSFHTDEFYKELWETISQGKVWHGTLCNRSKQGDEYWVESTIVPFLDEKGKPYKYVSARTDITALRQSEERLNRSQMFAKIGTWDWNISTGELFWSDRIWPLFGYNKESTETTYENFLDAVHPDDRSMVMQAVEDCVEHGGDYNIEHRVVWPDGSTHWVQESGDVVRSDDGKPLHMLGVVQDIDVRKIAELELKKSESQLHEAQALSHIGNWQADMISGKLYWSDEIYRIFGYEPGSIEPSVDLFRNAVHTDDLDLVLKSERQASKTGVHDVIHRIKQPEGGIRYVHELAHAETDDNGNMISLIGTVQDITNEMDIKNDLIDAREEAEKASKAKSQFLSSMSHELRTPMNAIMGFSQLLKIDPEQPLSEIQQDNINEILGAGNHLLDLINEVLDLTRIEAGRIDLSIESVVVGKVVTESLQLITPLAQKRGIEISLVCNRDEISFDQLLDQSTAVRADQTRLKQVLLNLLSNAVKYNCEKGKIIISCQDAEDNMTRFCITDTGYGLTQDQRSQLFIPFNRLGVEQTEVDGVGIGLVITKNIVELMGGKIGVESQSGEGSTFWFELPTDVNSSIQNNKADEMETTQSQSSDSKNQQRTVLYIEDNPANLRLVSQILARIPNINLLSAHEPVLGLELVSEHNPDLILLDINLPGMDGYEVLGKLRERELISNTPVIAISANAMQKDITRGMKAGFDDYITKPIDVTALLLAVEDRLSDKID